MRAGRPLAASRLPQYPPTKRNTSARIAINTSRIDTVIKLPVSEVVALEVVAIQTIVTPVTKHVLTEKEMNTMRALWNKIKNTMRAL